MMMVGLSIDAWERRMSIRSTSICQLDVCVFFDGGGRCGRGEFDGVDVKEEINNWYCCRVSLMEGGKEGWNEKRRRAGSDNLQRKSRNATLYKRRMYDTCVIPASETSFICSSVAPMNRKPEA